MILLTDEEMTKTWNYGRMDENGTTALFRIAKAQLRKVADILGTFKVDMRRSDEDIVPMVYLRILEADWQSLLKEVK